jgi:hypothetical protein
MATDLPGALAGERRLEVVGPLAPLLSGGGLRRGSTVVVVSAGAPGATTLALALVSGTSQRGSWCAVVGVPEIGLVAASQMGLKLERLALVAHPGAQWSTVVATLLDSMDAVVVRPPARLAAADARRLAARARERGSVAVILGAGWPEGADVRLSVHTAAWSGLGTGHGHLQARLVEVVATGRGAATRERRARVWLPGPTGAVAPFDDQAGRPRVEAEERFASSEPGLAWVGRVG